RDRLPQILGAPRNRILIDVALNGGARGVFQRLVRGKIRKALRQIDRVEFLRQPRHLADHRLGKLRGLLRSSRFQHIYKTLKIFTTENTESTEILDQKKIR